MRRIVLSAAIVVGFLAVSTGPAMADPVEILAAWGDEPTQIDRPTAAAVDPSGNVFIADGNDGYISKFSSDGTFVTRFGELGWAPGQLGTRLVLAVSDAGDVYVTDADYNRVQQFTNDGTFVRKWGTAGIEYGQFRFDGKPAGIAVDGDGHVFVADPATRVFRSSRPTASSSVRGAASGGRNPGNSRTQRPSQSTPRAACTWAMTETTGFRNFQTTERSSR